jgi:GxxExxY protein
MPFDDLYSKRVIGLAIDVHRTLGPGLFENVYEECLCQELINAGIPFQRQAEVPMVYKALPIDKAYRADILVGDDLLLEIKSVENLVRLHEAQILTYLRFSGRRVGLLFNFNVVLLKEGMRRYVM